MSVTHEPEIAEPGADELADGGGPSFRRVLVPIRSAADAAQTLAVAARACSLTSGSLRLLYVRIFDPPVRGYGRFYPQSVSQAAAVPDEALPVVWAHGVQATTAVVDAPRSGIAAAIAEQAAAWHADLIVMTRRASPAVCRLVMGSVPDEVMRKTSCPVLAVHPAPKAARKPQALNFHRHGPAQGCTSRAHRIGRALDFGQIWVNCHLIQAAEMPNGGFRGSGHGIDLSMMALEDYTRVKHIMTAVP